MDIEDLSIESIERYLAKRKEEQNKTWADAIEETFADSGHVDSFSQGYDSLEIISRSGDDFFISNGTYSRKLLKVIGLFNGFVWISPHPNNRVKLEIRHLENASYKEVLKMLK